LLREGEGVAAKLLLAWGADAAKARTALELMIGRGDRIVLGEIGLTPHAKRTIEMAVDEARRLGHRYIGTEHILLGLYRVQDCTALKILQYTDVSIDLEALRISTMQMLGMSSKASLQGEGRPDAVSVETTNIELPLLENIKNDPRVEHLNDQAKEMLKLAQAEAQRFQHNYIGTEHLLLGLVRQENSISSRVLRRVGVGLDRVRGTVEFIIGRGDRIVLGEMSLTPRARKVLELSADEGRRLGQDYIGPEHILLGLIREGEGIASGVLESLGVQVDRVRAEVKLLLRDKAMPEILDETVIDERVIRFNLSSDAEMVIAQAVVEARGWRQSEIKMEHLFLALLRSSETRAGLILKQQFGIEYERASFTLEALMARGTAPSPERLSFDLPMLDLLERARSVARFMRSAKVTSELLLLSLAFSAKAALAIKLLTALNIDLKTLQLQTFQYVQDHLA
jgi:ATP-dependent Clp protease ATP-binding subunit ClpA